MNAFWNSSAILNFVIAFVGLLFLVLVSIQITLNKILIEIKEIRVQKEKQQYKSHKNEGG